MISIQLLGGACLRSDATVIAGPPAQRHRVALLALVVDAWPQPLARDRATALLWPERDDAGGRRLLNLAVHVLRTALGEETIASLRDGLVFNPTRARCDLHDLRAAIDRDDPEQVARLYTGPLLDGFHLPESAEFAHWLDRRRDALALAHTRALLLVADRQERGGDVHGLVATCRRLVAADPHSAEHAQRLMRALDAAGERAAAIQHAAEHARRLRADLELEPEPAVTALAEQLRRAPAARPRLPSVAVLPFLNLGGDSAHEYFADGITEDVIAHLSKIRALKVISRASVMPFKARRETPREIGRALGTGTVLDGSVRHAGERVRIVATLVDVEEDRQIWAETYDREVRDIFAIQTDVALQIAAALKAELSPDERGRVATAMTRDIQAYRLFLQGRQRFIQYATADLERAVGLFELAIERDPAFAMAYVLLAMTHIELAEQGMTAPREAYAAAQAAAARALELAPDLGDAHATAGYLRMVHDFDWAGAERGLLRAIELNPGSGYAYDLYARLCWAIERYDEAIPLGRRAQELDPAANRSDMTTMLLRAARYDEALAQARLAVEVEPGAARARATHGWALYFTGRREEAVAELERAAENSGRSTLWLGQLAQMYALVGERERARDVVREMEERARDAYVSPYHFAYAYTGLGEADRALDLLERAVAERTGAAYSIKGSFLFRSLREHPRWRALMRRMNLA